jgi:Fe-Mn family superoxide dismutase
MSEETLEVHHGKHHAAYVNNLNGQIKGTDMDGMDVVEIMMKSWNNGSPAATFNNAAQVVNHTFFWESMGPNCGGKPSGDLATAIDRDFGSFEEFKAQFSAAGATQFGSGWAWLSVNNATKKLEVSKTPNAENPWAYGQATPILTMDVWEHAYYLDVKNRRPDYISGFFDLISWDAVAARYAAALSS